MVMGKKVLVKSSKHQFEDQMVAITIPFEKMMMAMISDRALNGTKKIVKMMSINPRTFWRATLRSFWETSIIQISVGHRRLQLFKNHSHHHHYSLNITSAAAHGVLMIILLHFHSAPLQLVS